MLCPKCGARCTVLETRPSVVACDETYRKLSCNECAHDFYTVEFPVLENEAFMSAYKQSARAAIRRRTEKGGV